MTSVHEYVASGYFLSRHVVHHDCTGVELRRISMANDHSARRFFPDGWALSWSSTTREQRVEQAATFELVGGDLDDAVAWADRSFGTVFGAWSVFFELDRARAVARSLLKEATDLELWGVGLRRSLIPAYCDASTPPPPQPGFAPTGASGMHLATCARGSALAAGGTVLGHEILIEDTGCCFNSLESRHLDERQLLREAGVVCNPLGLIDSFEEALRCCRFLESRGVHAEQAVTGWLPWLLVQYPL